MRRARAALELLAPVLLVVLVALFGTIVSSSTQTYVVTTLVNVAIVVALYVFIGNSGVVSFGHISFVAVGAWTAVRARGHERVDAHESRPDESRPARAATRRHRSLTNGSRTRSRS